MGTTLTGTQINNTYDGLIKTTDNTAITATTKLISDGLGNDTCIKVGTAGTDFLGAVDFSAATVTGLPAAAAGLVSGAGADSLKNADSLVTNPASAAGAGSIALGDAATASGTCAAIAIGLSATSAGCSVAIGPGSNVVAPWGVAVGRNSDAGPSGIAIGNSTDAGNSGVAVGPGADNGTTTSTAPVALGFDAKNNSAARSVAIGSRACTGASAACGVVIGANACTTGANAITIAGNPDFTACGAAGSCSVAIGFQASATNNDVSIGNNAGGSSFNLGAVGIGCNARTQYSSVAIGCNADGTAADVVAVGKNTNPQSNRSISIGLGASTAGFPAEDAIAIGCSASATAADSVALGKGVTAATANTVSVKALETQTASTPTAGGIIMNDAGSVARRLNIDASGNLQIDSTPVGGGGAAGLVNGTGADSLKNADSLVTNPANASGSCSIAIGDGACAPNTRTIAIGVSAKTSAFTNGGVAIGNNACAGAGTTSLGRNARATGIHAIAIGGQCNMSTTTGGACATATASIAIGTNSSATSNRGVAIGDTACTTGNQSVAIGNSVTASRANALTTCELVACAVGKGIVVTSPDGLTTLGIGIDNTGAIVTYTP